MGFRTDLVVITGGAGRRQDDPDRRAHGARAGDAHCPRDRREVFIAPPWAAIYVNDRERRQDFAEAQRTHDAMVATYEEFGYDLVALPCASVSERADFVLERLLGADGVAREG